jgi:hypothetical protein
MVFLSRLLDPGHDRDAAAARDVLAEAAQTAAAGHAVVIDGCPGDLSFERRSLTLF